MYVLFKLSPVTGGGAISIGYLGTAVSTPKTLLTGQTPLAGCGRAATTRRAWQAGRAAARPAPRSLHRLLELGGMGGAVDPPTSPSASCSPCVSQAMAPCGSHLVLLQRGASLPPVNFLPLQPKLPFNSHPGHKVRIVGNQQQGAQVVGQHLSEQLARSVIQMVVRLTQQRSATYRITSSNVVP